jgi:hypothetical protein
MKTQELQFEHLLEELQSLGGGDSSSEKEVSPKRRRYIKIKLKFHGYTDVNRRFKRVESTFRLMKDDPKTISLNRIQSLGDTIQKKFNNWKHRTGKMMCCYANHDQGYQLQLQVPDLAEGRRVIEQILDIQGHSPDWADLYYSQSAEPATRYKETPDKVSVAGQLVRPPAQRSLATVSFFKAYIKFPATTRYRPLCDTKKVLFKDFKFLESAD